jgi:hypothetical protein
MMIDLDEARRKTESVFARCEDRGDTVAIGIAVAYADGSVGTAYVSEAHSMLFGALRVLDDRLIQEYETR